MTVDFYERIWMWLAAGLIVVFLGAITLTAGMEAVGPPGHIETVNPATLDTNPEFSEPGVRVMPDGHIVATVVAQLFSFSPDPIEVPANRPITFRLTSADVIHGFLVIGTDANAMAVPGYVNEFTVTFPTPGEYVIACDEYCGVLHANMVGKLIVRKELP